ncbi:START domain-containing protein [Caerostris darwini]|uniref:START domain-containing protein n=1 Tax=Caerostris darwini TaxID=1538125 RepID=A0AAV4UVC8_9ARAC|nr:START domain-containing protein [Caerostris darwini]
MEFISVDIPFLLICIFVLTTIFALYTFPLSFPYFSHDCVETFSVVEVIRALKKVCPIDFGNKWRLLHLDSGLTRCWTKKIQFPGYQNNITLYGTACKVACSCVYAFSLIADVTKWGEWEPLPSTQCLLLKPFCDSKLQRDALMQADQVVGIQRGINVQSYIAMYRFMSFTEKTVKWILFWNAKKLEFMFFLIQPTISKTNDDQCVITHIFGSKVSSSYIAPLLAQRMRNIRDFLLLSQTHIVSSKYTSTISKHSCHKILNNKSDQDIDRLSSKVDFSADCDQYVFMLVPIIEHFKCLYSTLIGFQLTVKEIDEKSTSKKKKDILVKSAKPKEKLKRSASETCIRPKHRKDFSSSLELNTISDKQSNSIIAEISSDCKRKTSVIVEENFKIDLNSNEKIIEDESINSNAVHSHSVTCNANVEKSKSSSFYDISETQTDEDIYVNLHIIHENNSQENASCLQNCNKSDIFCSSTSDFELVESNQDYLDSKLADFLTQGNYGASELQAEMMKISFDKSLSPELQSYGGWIYYSTYKNITVLSKTTAGQFMKIISFLCQMELPVDAKDVWKCVKNPRFRFYCDETVKTVKIVERISDSQKLIHVYHEINNFLRKEGIDFCLLQTEREEANLFYSSFHSIEYEKCPFMTSVIRGSLRPSGWVVEDLGSHNCKVTHMMQAVVSSADNLFIQVLGTLVPLAMHNLRQFTTLKPK